MILQVDVDVVVVYAVAGAIWWPGKFLVILLLPLLLPTTKSHVAANKNNTSSYGQSG